MRKARNPQYQHAREVFDTALSGIATFEQAIAQIIKEELWEPLGYGTFGDAWAAEFRHVTLIAEMRPHVVYQMFAEGMTPEQVSEQVKGIGPDQAKNLKRQRDNGVPPNLANKAEKPKRRNSPDTTIVVEHERKVPYAPPAHIRIDIDAEALKVAGLLAQKVDKSVKEIAREATDHAFRALAKRYRMEWPDK